MIFRSPISLQFVHSHTEFANLEQLTKVTLQHYANATQFHREWYKAWHKLGTVYYNLVMTERQLMFGAPEIGALFPALSPPQQQQTHAALPPEHGLAAPFLDQQELIPPGRQFMDPPVLPPLAALAPCPAPPAGPLGVSDPKSPMAMPQNPQLITSYASKAIQCFLKAILLAEGMQLFGI